MFPDARPLPRLSPDTEFFWVSGADGLLRFLTCEACKRLVHPPTPICRHCRSTNVGVAQVSGAATVWSFTVVHQPFVDWLEVPYVVGVVAIAEDPAVHLTTNIVGCKPEEVRIGMEVQVQFARHGDVFLPLFAARDQGH
jgi:uncharacterized OB-fold protein